MYGFIDNSILKIADVDMVPIIHYNILLLHCSFLGTSTIHLPVLKFGSLSG